MHRNQMEHGMSAQTATQAMAEIRLAIKAVCLTHAHHLPLACRWMAIVRLRPLTF